MLIPFEERHYHAYMAAMMPARLDHVRALKDDIFRSRGTMTWLLNGRVLAIGGVVPLWEGVGEAWVLLTSAALQKPYQLNKIAIACLRQARPEFRRIQATVASDFREGIRWALSLGFSFEDVEGEPTERPTSKMSGYGPNGKDYFMLSLGRGRSWQKSH